MNPEMMSEHQQRVAEFMRLANQELPEKPTMPSAEVRMLRATIEMEEMLELIDDLGFCVEVKIVDGKQRMTIPIFVAHDRGPNLTGIADDCADISVVTIGTLLACGIADRPLLEEVDRSNLAKFDLPVCPTHGAEKMVRTTVPGGYLCVYPVGDRGACGYSAKGPYRREDGKWIKGPEWKMPDIDGAILKSNDPVVHISQEDAMRLSEEEYLKQSRWEHIMTDADGVDTWRYRHELRKANWPPSILHTNGTQHYWDRSEAVKLQREVDSWSPTTATIKAWTVEQFEECKNQLVALHEFEAAEKLVTAIRRMKSGEPPPKSHFTAAPIEAMTRSIDVQRIQCNHCRGILSQKLVKDMLSEARCEDIFRCPNCMNILNSKDLIHAEN